MNHALLLAATLAVVSCAKSDDSGDAAVVIDVSRLVEFGEENGAGSFVTYPIPSAPTRAGFYLVADEGRPGPVPVFDATGQFVRGIGGQGEGPGEFQSVNRVMLVAGDSVLVIDNRLLRASVFGPDLRFVRAFPMPLAAFETIQVAADVFVAAPSTMQPQAPFVRFSAMGTSTDSFGPPASAAKVIPPRRLASGASGSFWSVPWAVDYALEQWDTLGQKLRELRPGSPWATQYAAVTQMSPTVPPQWQIQGLWVAPSGEIVVLALVADPDWSKGLGPPMAGEGGTLFYPVADRDRVYDAIVEVIDSATGAVLASRRFDEAYRMVPYPGVIARVLESADGTIRVALTSVTIRPHPRLLRSAAPHGMAAP